MQPLFERDFSRLLSVLIEGLMKRAQPAHSQSSA
jgi:hypothetical protein